MKSEKAAFKGAGGDFSDTDFTSFERAIDPVETRDRKQRDKLLEIVDKCPVHRTLHGEMRITTTLRFDT